MKFSRETKIGLIVITGIAIALFGINYLKGSSLITSHRKYYVIYDKIDGLKASNPIIINGFKIGQVSHIELMPDNSGRLVVTLSIQDRNLKVKRGSIARIVSSDILGSKAVEFFVSDQAAEHDKGDTLIGEREQGLKELIAEQVDPLKAKFVQLMGSIDSVMVTVNEILDEKAVNDLNESIGGIRGAILSLERTAIKLDNLVESQSGNINATLTNTRVLTTSLANSSKDIENMISNFSDVSNSIEKANIGATLDNARLTMEKANNIVDRINKGEGSMGLLLKSDSLHNELVAATTALEKLFVDIQANPKRYVSFSVFGKSEKSLLTNEEQMRLKELINTGKK